MWTWFLFYIFGLAVQIQNQMFGINDVRQCKRGSELLFHFSLSLDDQKVLSQWLHRSPLRSALKAHLLFKFICLLSILWRRLIHSSDIRKQAAAIIVKYHIQALYGSRKHSFFFLNQQFSQINYAIWQHSLPFLVYSMWCINNLFTHNQPSRHLGRGLSSWVSRACSTIHFYIIIYSLYIPFFVHLLCIVQTINDLLSNFHYCICLFK